MLVRIILETQSKRKTITIEYILIDGVNDSLDHAKDLAKILKWTILQNKSHTL